MHTQILRTADELAAVRDEWHVLSATTQSPLLDHDWWWCCARALHPTNSLRIVMVRDGDRLVAAAPLVAVDRLGFRRLEFIGMHTLNEPSGLLYSSEAALEALLRALVSLGVPFALARLEARSLTSRLLSSLVAAPGLVIVRTSASSLSVPLRGNWSEFEQLLSHRARVSLPRLHRRAGRLGPVRSETLSPSPDEVEGLLQVVMQVEASGWKGRNGSAISLRPDLRKFFSEYSRSAASAGRLRISLLWFGERVAAVQLGVVAHRKWWQLKIAYDESMGEHSPGLQLTHAVIQRAFDEDLAAFEFLGSAEAWEELWNPVEREYELAAVYPPTVTSAFALAVDVGQTAARRGLTRGGALVRRALAMRT